MPYSGNPADSPADEMRFLLGDTDKDSPRLTDAEVTYLLTKYGEPVRAAYQAALRLLARYSGRMSKSVGPTRLEYGSLVTQYRELADALAAQGGALGAKVLPGPPTAGGLDAPLWSDVEWEAPSL